MKISSRDCLDVLRRFGAASDNNVPRDIENIKIVHPISTNTMASFKFNRQQYHLLFDDIANDNMSYLISQIKSIKPDVKGEFLLNHYEGRANYSMPFRGKDCYLFVELSNRKRLDSHLAETHPENSRSTWQKYIKAGYVTVNNQIINSVKSEINHHDKIEINIPPSDNHDNKELPIVYIDDNVIVVNKPAGVLTHSKGVINNEFTVADFFKRYTTYNLDTNRPGIVHRLDRGTSGVIIGARNSETAKSLQKQFSDRKTKKIYYAIVTGKPKLTQANIDLPVNRNPSKPSTFRVDPNGKKAFTEYQVIDQSDKYSLLKLQPKTGRTHQLRVHMKYIGTPILGDNLYGKTSDRLYLHAHSLEITIPNGDRRVFSAKLPNEFLKYFPKVNL
ncbi:MAG: RluA family pseudouridine synthase [Candidatus Saccharimonadales bacterium]